MKFSEWLRTVPAEIRNDPLWNQEAYRLALFVADLAWCDATKLFSDGRTVKLAAQLIDAVGSVGANISEGYSRGHGKDRARFYEYTLGSGRESRTWYFDARHVLGEPVAHHRIQLHTQIIRLLLTMLPATRGYSLHDGDVSADFDLSDEFTSGLQSPDLAGVLEIVPMPDQSLTKHGTRNTPSHDTAPTQIPN